MTLGGLPNSSPQAEAELPVIAPTESAKEPTSTALDRGEGIGGADIIQGSSSGPAAQPSNPRLEILAQKRDKLKSTIATLEAERASLAAVIKMPSDLANTTDLNEAERTKLALGSSQRVIKEHIALLHKYNEIKDIGLGLIGLVAESRGMRVASVMEEFGMTEKD